MNYTVNKLAKLSGVSIRTLRFYDEIGLLKPAFIAENGYRYYQEAQILMLQQILFLRELGFELKQIRTIIEQSDFDKVVALQAHKKVLHQKIARLQELMITVDKTINHLQGNEPMKEQEMFYGFDSERQKQYEEYLITKLGDKVKPHLEESKRNVKQWTKEEWNTIMQEGDALNKELAQAIEKKLTVDSAEVQKLIGKHFIYIKKFWTPNKESYAGLGQLYIEHPDFRKFYEKYHPHLAAFLATAMKIYADKELA